jgi:prolyl-tRNA editing enzyme YbaK/EbsC (Cys-tRNA(Pro) deacylase)
MGGILQSLYRYTGLMEPDRLPLLGFRTDFDVMIEASMQRCEEILTAGPRLHEAVALLSR